MESEDVYLAIVSGKGWDGFEKNIIKIFRKLETAKIWVGTYPEGETPKLTPQKDWKNSEWEEYRDSPLYGCRSQIDKMKVN